MTATRYPLPAKRQRTETEVKRSRFIATVDKTVTREESREFIRTIQREFSDANHNCWACVIGAPGCTLQSGMSDDGEPRGAAGKPMLSTLLHCGIGDITVVVSRYFGGTRLGKGGMVRAYTNAVLNALTTLPTAEKIAYQALEITMPYRLLEQVQPLYPIYEIDNLQLDYSDQVKMKLQTPVEHYEKLCTHLKELGGGRIIIKVIQAQQPE